MENHMAKTFGAMLGQLLRTPAKRQADPHRKAREEATKLAAAHGIEIERFKKVDGGGFNVFPPKGFTGEDPHDGNHYAVDWQEVLEHVRAYVPAAA